MPGIFPVTYEDKVWFVGREIQLQQKFDEYNIF